MNIKTMSKYVIILLFLQIWYIQSYIPWNNDTYHRTHANANFINIWKTVEGNTVKSAEVLDIVASPIEINSFYYRETLSLKDSQSIYSSITKFDSELQIKWEAVYDTPFGPLGGMTVDNAGQFLYTIFRFNRDSQETYDAVAQLNESDGSFIKSNVIGDRRTSRLESLYYHEDNILSVILIIEEKSMAWMFGFDSEKVVCKEAEIPNI